METDTTYIVSALYKWLYSYICQIEGETDKSAVEVYSFLCLAKKERGGNLG